MTASLHTTTSGVPIMAPQQNYYLTFLQGGKYIAPPNFGLSVVDSLRSMACDSNPQKVQKKNEKFIVWEFWEKSRTTI